MRTGVALVTGGSGGIGSVIVNTLYAEGYTIALHYSTNKEAAEKIKAEREGIHLFQFDFLSGNGELIDTVVEQLGSIDYLVNCAGILADCSIFDLKAEQFDHHFAINTRMPYLLSAKAFEYMQKQKFGRIINISSIAVKYGMGRMSGIQYAGSKAALEALSTGLSKLGAEHNILVNTIRPGAINTSMQKERPGLKERINMIPLKRMGEAQEVADMVTFLCSSKGDFITGQTITIGGGEG